MGMIRWVRRIAIAGILLVAMTALGVLVHHYTARDGRPAAGTLASTKVVVVLASGIRKDGRPTGASRIRLARALSLIDGRRDIRVICSGGLARSADGRTAAQAMRAWAIDQGFPADRVIAEGRSRSTLENLVISTVIAEKLGARPDDASLMIVTDTTHGPRARALAWFLGWTHVAVATSNTFDVLRPWNKVTWTVRESLAIWWNVVKIVIWRILGLAGLTAHERLEYIY